MRDLTHSCRCTGQNEIARLQREVHRDKGHQRGDIKNHVVRVPVLHGLAIQATLNLQFLRITHRLQRHHARSHRTKRIQRFSAEPTRLIQPLDIALAHIVGAGETQNVIKRLFRRNMLAAILDKERQFCLVMRAHMIKPAMMHKCGKNNGVLRSNQRIGCLGKKNGLARNLCVKTTPDTHIIPLRNVLKVIASNGNNLARIHGVYRRGPYYWQRNHARRIVQPDRSVQPCLSSYITSRRPALPQCSAHGP